MHKNRTLIRGDNLTEMRNFPDECVDLIATDPPFNSKRDYFILYHDEHGQEPDVLVKAFADTWRWGNAAEEAYRELQIEVGGQVGDTIEGLRKFLNETPMMAYLVMMAIRLVEMHRILNPTGSLYLHCDPTASHYLKIILDSVFGVDNFRREIIWNLETASGYKSKVKGFIRGHDVILYYVKDFDKFVFNKIFQPHKPEYIKRFKKVDEHGRHYRDDRPGGRRQYLDETPGVALTDVWSGIMSFQQNTNTDEITGYPTQKPVELYEPIIEASSDTGGLVLDPFCGCGTTLMAAESLGRQWIGIDLTYLATGAVKLQIEKYFPQLLNQIKITGTPENEQQALELARTNPFNFEEWAVTHVLKFKANAKKVADGGIDGTMKFPLGRIQGKQAFGTAIAQVKGGSYSLGHIRDFRTAMKDASADIGVFLVTKPPSQKMLAEAAKTKTYEHPSYEFTAPCLQIYQIQDYYNGILPKLPHAVRDVL